MPWRKMQHDFVVALRNPNADIPSTIAETLAKPSRKRFNVYRNNVTVSLVEALGAGYPVVKQLVGEEFFTSMARAYTSKNLPKSPIMLYYGDDFPEFIADFAPAAEVPFLADVARVEKAWHASYHAAEDTTIGIEQLQAIPQEQLENVRFRLHPSLYLIDSEWPVISIWHIHQSKDDPAAAMKQLLFEAEAAMLVRPGWHVDTRLISQTTFKFFSALQTGTSLGKAAELLVEAEIADMADMLQLLFATNSVVELHLTKAD